MENDESLQIVVLLSKPLSFTITMQVLTINESAAGKYKENDCHLFTVFINYIQEKVLIIILDLLLSFYMLEQQMDHLMSQ